MAKSGLHQESNPGPFSSQIWRVAFLTNWPLVQFVGFKFYLMLCIVSIMYARANVHSTVDLGDYENAHASGIKMEIKKMANHGQKWDFWEKMPIFLEIISTICHPLSRARGKKLPRAARGGTLGQALKCTKTCI